MAFGTGTSRVLGLVRDQLFAAYFPLAVKDAWTAAWRLPNLFRRLLGEGSLSVSFVPVFVQVREEEAANGDLARVRSQNLFSTFYSTVLVVVGALTVFGTLWPEFFLRHMLDPSFLSDPERGPLAIRMSSIMFCFIFFMSTYALFMGVLNSLGKFAWAAMAPSFFNIAMIASNLLPTEWFHEVGDAIAWGVAVGGALQVIVLIPALKRVGYLPQFSLKWWDSDVWRIWRNMLPGMIGLGLLQITTIVNLRLASSLGDGSITYIYLADRILELPLSLVAVSLGAALLPTLSSLWAQKRPSEMISTLQYYFGLTLFVAVPAAIGIGFLAAPIARLLFERGQFNADDTAGTALVLQVYAALLVVSSCVRVLVPSYYAVRNTWLPAVVSGVCVAVHVLMAPLLMEQFGLRGLVASNVLTSTLNLILLLGMFSRWVGPFDWRITLRKLGMILIPSAGLVAFLWSARVMIQSLAGAGIRPEWWLDLLGLMASILGGVLIYFALARWLKMEEFTRTWALIERRLARFRSSSK